MKKVSDDVVQITLDRPQVKNAVSFDMVGELKEAFQGIKEDDSVKLLTLTGAGDVFCSGGDLHDFHGDLGEQNAFQMLYGMKEVLYELARFPIPTVALLNGPARGGGTELATACDFRYIKEGVTCGFTQGDLGLTTGWGGGTLLYHRIPNLHAYHWLLSSSLYDSNKLIDIGWVQGTYVDDVLEQLKPYTDKTVEQVRIFKQQYIRQQLPLSISTEMDEEVRRCSMVWDTPEHKEAIQKFLSAE
ncbi:enoyl-CoA hydratase/isomerase family protein [Pontibacillus halophilus]|uniref:enoyl-CoA hydratase/isomerase family protein n=1 Tax=Pontibacillus halophilus TaxID=516704 RepID=UPI001377EA3E|nr:enoyl-CoA hydratase/isomerase family protein [Pontibacillus halophilus]